MSLEINNLYLGKWESLLPSVDKNSIDLIVTSPPYNVNLGSNKKNKNKYDTYDDNMPYEDYLEWMTKLFTECNRVLKGGGRLCINIGDGANGCYDSLTEIMTSEGWKFFKDLTLEDSVITMNPQTFEIEWQNPTEVQTYPYDGEMYEIKSSRMDLLVTPNHRMFVEKHHTKGWGFEQIKDMGQRQYYLPGAKGMWTKEGVSHVTLPSMPLRNRKNKIIPEKQIDSNLFGEFLGWYLSEGCTGCNSKSKFIIDISQDPNANADNYERIYDCIKNMGYNPHRHKSGIKFYDKQLCTFLDLNIPKYSYNKCIPQFCMSFSRCALERLFDAMIRGDGCYHSNGQVRFFSSSKKMAEQMQIIGLKIGKISSITSKTRVDNGSIRDTPIESIRPQYTVTYSERNRLWVDTKQISKVQYNGNVHCCSVPNKIVYVKRNNFSVWCGNSVPTHADFTHILLNMHKDNKELVPFKMMTTIVWDKKQIGNATSWGSWLSPSQPSFPTQFEFILVVGKGTKKHQGEGKVTVSKDNFMRNSKALWSFPPETEMNSKYFHPACVDADTECLTSDGWRSYRSLKVGDKLASLNLESGLMEWKNNLYTTIYKHNGSVVEVNGRHLNMKLSPIHRCVIKTKRGFEVKMAKDLRSGDIIPCSCEWSEEDASPHHPSIDLAYLIGFFIGDGHYKVDKDYDKAYTVAIDQSLTSNSLKVEKLKSVLNALNAEYKEYTRTRVHTYDNLKSSDHISFCIKGHIRDEILKYAQYPVKRIPKGLLMWPRSVIKSFVDGISDADGHLRGNNGNVIVTQFNNAILDELHAIGVRLGMDSYMNGYSKGDLNGYVEFTNKKHKLLRNAKESILAIGHYEGVMWCPLVEGNGTFVARRQGRVFITGNCFPTELPRRLIDQLTYEGDIVLDPFSGVGTTCAVAKQMGRKYLGLEMSEKYHNIAEERLGLIPTLGEGGLPKWMKP